MIYIGTTGWDYDFWNESFYPSRIDKKLPYYSKIAAFTELRSTYKELPSEEKVQTWFDSTPDDFIFVSRMHKDITQIGDELVVQEDKIAEYFDRFEVLGKKHQMTMLHFPMSFQMHDDTHQYLMDLLDSVNSHFDGQLLVEAPNRSWQKMEVRDQLAEKNACLVGNDRRPIPSLMRSRSVYYLRLLGDKRTVPRSEFGENPLDRDDDIKHWAEHIKFIDQKTDAVFVSIDNHFSGNAVADAKTMVKHLKQLNCSLQGFDS